MKESTNRALLVAALSANVLFLALALLDFALSDSQYMWPIFVGWAFLIILIVLVAFASSGVRIVVQPAFTPVIVERTVEKPTPKAAVTEVAAVPTASLAPTAVGGPFVYNGYTLHSRSVELKNGGERVIYFFAKSKPSSGKPSAKPAGFHVGVNERTGLPFLKKGTGSDGEDLTPELEAAYRPQCSALTDAGSQCRNSSRGGSKYCSSHFGYQPPAIAKAAAKREDTLPRVAQAPDTLPSVRRRATA